MGTLNVLESSHPNARTDSSHSMLTSAGQVLPSQEAAAEKAQSIRITTYFTWSSLAEIIPAWENILNENATLSIFSTPEWLKSWWDAFGSNRQLVVLAFLNAAGVLVGLAPMYWETSRHPVFGRVKQLRLVGDGSGDSDNLDFIIRPGSEEACVSAFIQWMARQRNCGICSLNTLPENSLALGVLLSHLAAENWPVRKTSTPNSAILLPATWETYIEGLSPKFRRLVTRCRRKLESQFEVRFRRCETAEEIPAMLEVLYSLHQKRWNSVHEPGSFGSAQRRELYAQMAKAFFEKGWLELWSLELNGKPVAAQMSFRYRDRVYGLQEGFDTDYSADHVGYVLRAGLLESFIRSGVKAYDFLGGTSAQKQRWGAEVGAYTNLQFATPRTIASCCLAVDKKAADGKEWLRHHLPSSAWNVLHRVKIDFAHDNRQAPSDNSAEQLPAENGAEGPVSNAPSRNALETGQTRMAKILQIGNYPPPACGWAVQTKLLTEEIRRRGHVCEVLNINESRKIKSTEYIDVQDGLDYLVKLCRFAAKGYRFQVNVNGQSRPGYVLAILAAIVGRLAGCPSTLSWRGGLQQKYFPREDNRSIKWAYRQLFRLAGRVSCDSLPIKRAIESYGIKSDRVVAIPPFSKQNLAFELKPLGREVETFLSERRPVFFCYVSFRPEYELPMLRETMRNFRRDYPGAGFVWLGFPSKEMPAVQQYVAEWSDEERQGLLLLGNLPHDEFLTLLGRCTAYLRTPMCDGVAASVLESLALGVPVIASDNSSRPNGVTTYRDKDEADLRAKLGLVIEQYSQLKDQTRLDDADDNIELTVNWLLGDSSGEFRERGVELVHVR